MRGGYQRLDILSFGRHLLESGDLDPVYIALPKAVTDTKQLHRWLIAYWCFYHCGLASWASEFEGEDFWTALRLAAANEEPSPLGDRFPRGHERRHARGAQGIDMVAGLHLRYGNSPEGMVDYIVSAAPEYERVAGHTREHKLFGPWISFKVCDMVDRVLGVPVNFSEAAVFMFTDPVKAALILWRQEYNLPEAAKPRDQTAVIHSVVEYLKGAFSAHKAPPLYDRPVDLQEVETVLCKWKSHLNGHYPLFNDIDEIRAGLWQWGRECATAAKMHECMPIGSKT